MLPILVRRHQNCTKNKEASYEFQTYAMSLSNYASDLSDTGQYDEALERARQSLEIRERLAQKNPKGVSGDLFATSYFAHFLAWLYDQTKGNDQSDLEQILTF